MYLLAILIGIALADISVDPQTVKTELIVGLYDTFTWKGSCAKLNAVRVIKNDKEYCQCLLVEEKDLALSQYGSFIPTIYNGLTCLYGDRGAGAAWFIHPNYGRTHTLIQKTFNHISKYGRIGMVVHSSHYVALDKVERYSYDSRSPYINMSNIFGVHMSSANAYLQFIGDPKTYIGMVFRVHLKWRVRNTHNYINDGFLIIKIPGTKTYQMYNKVMNLFNELDQNVTQQTPTPATQQLTTAVTQQFTTTTKMKPSPDNQPSLCYKEDRILDNLSYILFGVCALFLVVIVILIILLFKRNNSGIENAGIEKSVIKNEETLVNNGTEGGESNTVSEGSTNRNFRELPVQENYDMLQFEGRSSQMQNREVNGAAYIGEGVAVPYATSEDQPNGNYEEPPTSNNHENTRAGIYPETTINSTSA